MADTGTGWKLVTRLAMRELRTGFRGFRIFLACLILGVAAIAGVGSLSAALVAGLNAKGQSILGGDIALRLMHRQVTPDERDWLTARFHLSHSYEMRAMTIRGERNALVEAKAVDRAYPLHGQVALGFNQITGEITGEKTGAHTGAHNGGLQNALAEKDGVHGLAVEPILLELLDAKIGDFIALGEGKFQLRATILSEPDRMSGGFSLAPRVFLSHAAARQSGLFRPGSLVENHYRLRGRQRLSETELEQAVQNLNDAFPEAGWRIRNRTDAAPSLRRSIEQIAIFLTMVGLTALVVGGVGIGNAVTAYLDSRRRHIAILKSLGATRRLVFATYMMQIFAMTLIGIIVGLGLGASTPWLAGFLFADLLPVDLQVAIYAPPLFSAAGFGFLAALAFALRPLARACDIPAAALFRDRVSPSYAPAAWPVVLTYILCFAGLVTIAFQLVRRVDITIWFLFGIAVSFVLLKAASQLVMFLARKAGRPRQPELRLALSNIYRPDAPTQAVILSMGLAVALLSAIALIDGNISAQIKRDLPERAPSFFFLDIQSDQLPRIQEMVSAAPGFNGFNSSPMLRGKLTHVNDVPAREVKVSPDAAWVLRGDRGLTYAAAMPEGTELTAGSWWPADYQGPPLVSMDEDIARGLNVGLGDRVTLNVLGRPLTAEISSLRRINWNNMGINFVLLLSPQPLAAAPHTHLMTVNMAAEGELALRRALLAAFPNVTIIRVKETIETINNVLKDFGLAVRVMSLVSLLAGILVLAGAMASGHRNRVYDAVVMKVLGATRRRIIAAYLIEYALMGLGAAVIAAFIGAVAAWALVRFAMQSDWVMLPGTLVSTVLVATVVTMLLGLLGTWRVLGSKAVPVLRAD